MSETRDSGQRWLEWPCTVDEGGSTNATTVNETNAKGEKKAIRTYCAMADVARVERPDFVVLRGRNNMHVPENLLRFSRGLPRLWWHLHSKKKMWRAVKTLLLLRPSHRGMSFFNRLRNAMPKVPVRILFLFLVFQRKRETPQVFLFFLFSVRSADSRWWRRRRRRGRCARRHRCSCCWSHCCRSAPQTRGGGGERV